MALWLQRDLQNLRPTDHPFQAWRGDGLPSDAVHLVKGVGFQELLVCCPDEDLQPHRSRTLVSMKLKRGTQEFTDMIYT